MDGDGFGDALLFHGDAVEDVGKRHGPLVVGDDDELGLVRHLFQHFLKTDDVRFVERRVDFVEQAERTGPDFEDGEHESDGSQRFFTAGKKGEVLHPFAERVGADLDPGFQNIGLVGELQFRLSPAEQAGEDFLEVFVHLFEGFFKPALGGAVDLLDGFMKELDRNGMKLFSKMGKKRVLILNGIQTERKELRNITKTD